MTDTAALSWLELPSAEPPSDPHLTTSACWENDGELMRVALTPNETGWQLRVECLEETGWASRFDDTVASTGETDGQPSLFPHQLKEAGALRLDAVGAGITVAWIRGDGGEFKRLNASSPLLDQALLTLDETGILAFATTTEHPLPHLWRTTALDSADWQLANHQPPAETVAQGLCGLQVFAGRPLVAFRNPNRGFSLWQMDDGWKPLIESGAWKFALNGEVFAMREFQGALYLATGVTDVEQARISPFHQQGFELLRVYPNADWDLLVGQPVFTPIGLRHPLSTLGAGMDDVSNDRVLALKEHAGRLYLLGRSLDGLRLWNSADGIEWEPVEMPDAPALHVAAEVALISTRAGLCMTEGVHFFQL